jgi:hypothetical protein
MPSIDPGKPCLEGSLESFNGKFHEECRPAMLRPTSSRLSPSRRRKRAQIPLATLHRCNDPKGCRPQGGSAHP